jgi:crotonobetainyl-CoA:carnitine CoA-transferase CaiB-like acyl-CoA transferase
LDGRNRWRESRTPGGEAAVLLPPTMLSGVDLPVGDVPALGAHSRNILSDLGYSPDAIGELVDWGVTTLG